MLFCEPRPTMLKLLQRQSTAVRRNYAIRRVHAQTAAPVVKATPIAPSSAARNAPQTASARPTTLEELETPLPWQRGAQVLAFAASAGALATCPCPFFAQKADPVITIERHCNLRYPVLRLWRQGALFLSGSLSACPLLRPIKLTLLPCLQDTKIRS